MDRKYLENEKGEYDPADVGVVGALIGAVIGPIIGAYWGMKTPA